MPEDVAASSLHGVMAPAEEAGAWLPELRLRQVHVGDAWI